VEAELEAEQRRARDMQAENRKLTRMLQELRTQSEEDRRAMTELADQVNTLQQRIKTLRRQLEEAVRRPRLSLHFNHLLRSVVNLRCITTR